ncbi:primosomal protein N' [Robiginitalea sp. SC105]|uniref:replication restart helicase PriA n=1 Tax=Robiginitalea sp. SC105 TaxID=2762332 RepID=UPI001639B6AB|nr:primosomal protein N' [Robiginitalea sp. SC105]MBC2839482.1 primosomal protein N' [Robiginitalea sp. SC105]
MNSTGSGPAGAPPETPAAREGGSGRFVEVLLPLPLERNYTYAAGPGEGYSLEPGTRVAVPFGKSKLYTGLVLGVHDNPPEAYEPKEIYRVLDETPLVSPGQIRHWRWIAQYYMCTLGEVFRTAVPSVFLLQSETRVVLREGSRPDQEDLDDTEFLILEALEHQPVLSVSEISDIVDRKHVLPILDRMIARKILILQEKLQEGYKPLRARYIRLHPDFEDEEALSELMDSLSRAPKQSGLILHLFQLREGTDKPIRSKALQERSGVSRAILKALIDKGILEEYFLEEDRVTYEGEAPTGNLPELNPGQTEALSGIRLGLDAGRPVLLHGVTSSGKTEVYLRLIKEIVQAGRQVLYLVPEIAITEQLVRRLQRVLGHRVVVFHSRHSMQERAELWYHVQAGQEKASVVLGARSALFLPFADLGLIVVDEEHENTYKQFDPAPRYHARDAAIVLAQQAGARIVLGSATPSIESYHNARSDKYAYVRMDRRYGNVLLPEMELVDLSEQFRKKKMKGHFSERLREEVSAALSERRQIILFQNRRGYAPIVECASCGHAPQCRNCDVSLTYHQHRKELRCHYCGFHRQLETTCEACGNATLDTKGFGTEQVESELAELFPEARCSRMDLDTTRGKHAYGRIIQAFEARETDILVGTQMLTKGLDFRNVGLVGIMNADSLLNFPHFRAHERCYQLLTQVAGRAGRTRERGKVIIQTYNPHHQILKQVSTGSYEEMYADQVYEREQFGYPPALRIIKITFRHREYNRVGDGAAWFAKSLRMHFGKDVLGPEFPPVARIRNQYHKNILLKIRPGQGLAQTKNSIKRIEASFNAISQFRSIRVIYNVDYI